MFTLVVRLLEIINSEDVKIVFFWEKPNHFFGVGMMEREGEYYQKLPEVQRIFQLINQQPFSKDILEEIENYISERTRFKISDL